MLGQGEQPPLIHLFIAMVIVLQPNLQNKTSL